VAAGITILKDLLSFFGAVALAIPWILDFNARRKKRNVEAVQTTIPVKGAIIAHYESFLVAPKTRDFVLTLGGLGSLTISFFISLLQSLDVIAR
jgi:hypothetical protein